MTADIHTAPELAPDPDPAAHADGCIPSYGPRADCSEHPPTADDRPAVWLGQFALNPTEYQKACLALATAQLIAERAGEA